MNRNINIVKYIIIFSLSTIRLISQVSMPNVIEAYNIEFPIERDGILNEECWRKAQRISNFTQRELNEGQPITERTEVALVYTREKLYIGVWCYDSEPDKFTAKEMKRDFIYWTEDNFEIVFDTYQDKRNGYVFVINPNGARSDVQLTDEGKGFNMNWNGVWDASVVRSDSGWFAEIEIPFATLKFPDKEIQEWGVNFERNIRRKQEQAFWQGWSRDYDFEHVSHAGTLTGLINIYGKENLEFKPYITAGGDFPANQKRKTITKIGGDINYLVTPTLKLNVTANTDFGQVESDRAQINLSRFSLYFPEKREFFLEGKDFFDYFNERVFFTRRIGIHEGREVPIFGGVRLVGKYHNTNIGLLSIQTQSMDTLPTTNYSVLRLRQDVMEKSNIGMIITAKNQSGRYNYTFGTDVNYFTAKLFDDKNFAIGGSLTQSQTSDKLNKNNSAYQFYMFYPNDLIYAEITGIRLQKNFNPEMGFLRRDNFKMLYTNLQVRPRPDFIPWIHRFLFEPLELTYYWTDNTNELESVYMNFIPFGFQTKSGETFDIIVKHEFERLDEPFNIHKGVFIPAGKHWYTHVGCEFNTFEGRNIYFYGGFLNGGIYNGEGTNYWGQLRWTIGSHINLSADYTHYILHFPDGSFVTDEIGGRFEYAFNPKLYSSLFGQWNNDTKEILLNYRLNWIPVVGSDFYLAINQRISTDKNIYKLNETILLAKFVWRFAV